MVLSRHMPLMGENDGAGLHAGIVSHFRILAIIGVLLILGSRTNGQRVNVTLFTESQCPFCTRLLREQIWLATTVTSWYLSVLLHYLYNRMMFKAIPHH